MTQSKKSEEPFVENILTRNAEKQNISAKRALQFKKMFASITKSKHAHRPFKRKAYLYFLTLLQIPMHYIMFLFSLAVTYGAVLVVIMNTVILIGVGLPMFLLFVFMARYSRKGYIKYWQCLPLLKGAGYTIAMLSLVPEYLNCSSAALSMMYITTIFSPHLPWSDCKFGRATNTCIPMNYKDSENATPIRILNCSDTDKIPTFSTLNYLRFNKLNQYPVTYYGKLGEINQEWATAVTITWVLVSLFMIQGFRSFQNVMTVLHLITVLCWAVIFLCTIDNHGTYQKGSALFYGFHPLWQIEAWLDIFLYACGRNDPGPTVLISSLGLWHNPPNIDCLIIYSFKLLFLTALIIWVPILLQNIFNQYKIQDGHCIILTGFEIIFAVIPDILSRKSFPQVWLGLWFLCVCIHSFASVVYTYTATVDSLTDAFPKLSMYHIHLCGLMCLASVGINMIFLTRLTITLFYTWDHYGMVLLRLIVLAILTFALIFLYSITQLMNDFHFAYGVPPTTFWIQSWRITPFLILFETVFMLYRQFGVEQINRTTPTLVLLSYISAIFMLSPIFIVMLWKYCKNIKYQRVASLIRPDPGWGYYDLMKRLTRQHFNPQREVRYKVNRLKCKHQCLANSKQLRRLQQTQTMKKASLMVKPFRSEPVVQPLITHTF